MKKLLLLVLCAFSVILVNAQTKVNWGLELGLGMSTWMGYSVDGTGFFPDRTDLCFKGCEVEESGWSKSVYKSELSGDAFAGCVSSGNRKEL